MVTYIISITKPNYYHCDLRKNLIYFSFFNYITLQNSAHFEVQFDRTEKKHKNNPKVRARFAVTNSYLIRFGKRLTFDSFTLVKKKSIARKTQLFKCN